MAAVPTTGPIGEPHIRTYQAGVANLASGTIVAQGANDNTVVPCGANAQPIGVVNEGAINVGDPVGVVMSGEAIVPCGAPIVAPVYLTSNANGLAVPSAAAGDQVVGRAVSSASVAGDYLVVHVSPFIR